MQNLMKRNMQLNCHLYLANWKMQTDLFQIRNFFQEFALAFKVKPILKVINCLLQRKISIVICPPACYLSYCAELLKSYWDQQLPIFLGGQNCHYEEQGPFTGQISARMLHELGCKYVLVGHSEVRNWSNPVEDALRVELTIKAAINNKIIPIICIGNQHPSLCDLSDIIKQTYMPSEANMSNCYLAYEPVWCINSDCVPAYNQLNQAYSLLHSYLKLPILYGGSVNTNSINKLLIPGLSGFLIGRASLNWASFAEIIEHSVSSYNS